MTSIVRLTAADALLLARIGGVTIIESHGASAPPEVMQAYVATSFTIDACRHELMNEDNIFHAVYYNGQAAGYSKIVFNCGLPAVPVQAVTKLERLYLLQEFYALKLGQLLLQQAIELSKAAGERGMWLNVWKGNERAIRFYQKAGFETVGETEFVLTERHANPAWVMWLGY